MTFIKQSIFKFPCHYELLLAFVCGSLMVSASGCTMMNALLGKNVSAATSQNSAQFVTTTVPTVDAVVARIQKGVSGVDPSQGNFNFALNQVSANLPNATDPTKASGMDQVPVLVYGACADAVSNGAALSVYKVDINQSVSNNMSQLVQEGVQMVNAHVGNLAAAGTTLNAQVSALFTQLINNDVTAGANTSSVFVSVCLAANAFGVGMTGF